jgi:dihydrofolate reductase
MGKLFYSAITSLDGYIEDEHGKFDWAAPDDEVHAFINELERPVGTYLYGRRMYETMAAWESVDSHPYAEIWRAADKVVYSRTLESVASARTRIEREFDREAVRRLKEEGDVSIGGPALAAEAIHAGLVDEYHFFLVPVLIAGGKRAFPDGVRAELELLDQRRFDSGVVYLRYQQR